MHMYKSRHSPGSQLRPALDVLNLVDTSPNALQANLNNVTILKPEWGLSPRTNTLWSTID